MNEEIKCIKDLLKAITELGDKVFKEYEDRIFRFLERPEARRYKITVRRRKNAPSDTLGRTYGR